MKIFESGEGSFEGKYNFVDENNVYVGYDSNQNCCEFAGWYISDTVGDKIEALRDIDSYRTADDFIAACYLGGEWKAVQHDRLLRYRFDPDYFNQLHSDDRSDDADAIAVFRLIAADDTELFLHLFNSHNGYYAHGFRMKVGNEVRHEGEL